jgi:hypothetical protein
LVTNENDDVVADPLNMLNRCENYFCQLLNGCEICHVRPMGMGMGWDLSPSDVKIPIQKVEKHKALRI